MGRTTDVLRKGFRAARCLTSLKLATSRIKVMKNKRIVSAKQMRREIAQLIKSGQDAHVYITKADALIKQENMVAVYDILDQYCHAIMSRFPAVEMQRNCPLDMKEPIASIIYATPRCIELTELAAIKDAFVAKYGKEFAAAASELRPNCGVNTQVIELLSIRPATGDMKIKLMQEICKEHNVDWTPKEAMAGPAVATGHAEPMQATGTLGSIKANAVGVGEAGPSKIAPPQGVSKHGASYKSGLAEAVVSAANASKTSDQKQSSFSEGDVAKGKPSVSESLKGFMSTSPSTMKSSKAAEFGADATKVYDTKLSADEEEDARRLQARILQSLRGGSFADSEEVEAEANAEDVEKSMDADDQVVLSDSDNDSFVSVEEGRFEDDGEPSSHKEASRKESFQDNPIEGFTEGDLIRPNLSKKLSTSSEQDIYSRASSKNSGGAMDIHEVMLESSNSNRFPSEISHEDIPLKVNSKKILNAEAILEKERRKDSFSMEKLVVGKDSFDMGKLVEAQPVGLKENMMINESKDKVFSVNSRKSSNVEEIIEEKGRKDSLNMGKLVEAHSAEELPEVRNINEKSAEELSIDTSAKEGLQRKDSLEKKFAETTTESPVECKLSETDSAKARKTAEGLDDERVLNSEGVIEITPRVETTDIEVVRNPVEECLLDANEGEFIAEEKKSRLPASEMFKDQSGSERGFDEVLSPAADEEAYVSNEQSPGFVCDDASRVFGEQPQPSFENALETGDGELGSLPAVAKSAEQLVATPSSSAFAILENGQDFTAAAKAIAAEAARLAVLDYAKRLAESGSIPLNLSELSKLGIAFEENKGGPQNCKVEGTSASEALGYARDGKSYESDTIKAKKISKVEPSLNHDKVQSSHYVDADEMLGNYEKSKPSVVDDVLDVESGDLNASTTTFENEGKLQETVKESEDINPFATSLETTKDIDSTFSEIDNVKASWVDMMQPGQTSKVGNVGHDDHLEIFFRRKTPQLPEKDPMFDDERYSYPKLRPSFMEGSMPYNGFDLKKSSLQENLFSRPLFDTRAEGQSAVFKESSDILKSAVFNEGDGGSFKSPVFDEGPEPDDAVYSSDDGVDKSRFYSAAADKRGPQYSISFKSPVIFDPKPCYDDVADEEDLPIKDREESPSKGQLKWQSQKHINSAEHEVTGNQPTLNASDTFLGVAGNPLSRRSRRQPQSSGDNKHYGDRTSQLASRNSLLQQQEMESEWRGEVNVGEKNSLGKQQARPYVSSSSAKSQRSSDPPKWVTSQGDSSEDDWESTSTKISSTRPTKSPTRLDNRQRVTPEEDWYFPGNNLEEGSAGTGRKTYESPTRMTRQQLKTHVYAGVEEDLVGYNVSYKMPKTSKGHQHDIVEDDHIEDIEKKYKLSLLTSDLSNRISAGSGSESHLQQRHQPQKPGLRSEYKHCKQDEGERSRIRPMSNRLHPETYMEEEEHHMVSKYKPMAQDDDPLNYGRSKKSRVPNLSHLRKDVDEDNEQQPPRQEEPSVGFNVGESLRTSRPMSSRQQQKKKYIEEEEPDLVSRYKPTGLDDEPSDYGSDNWQSDNQVKSSPSRQFQSRQQEKKRFEEVESESAVRYNTPVVTDDQEQKRFEEVKSESAVRYNTPVVTDDRWQEEEKKQFSPQTPSQQKQAPQQNQNWPTQSGGYDRDSQAKRQSPASRREEKILKANEQSVSGRWQKSTTAEEEVHEDGEKQHLPSSSYKNHRKESKDSHSFDESCQLQEEKQGQKFTSSLKGQQEQVQQVMQPSQPLYSRKQDFRLEDNTSRSDQQELERLVGGTFARKERRPQEEGVHEQQEKTRTEANPLARWHQSQTEEEGTTGNQDKPGTKSQLWTQQPSESIPLPLESSISDPILLATIPPPVKKPFSLSVAKLESSSSAPSPSKSPQVQVPKLPKKPPNLDDLAANFEALVRARKGE